MSFYIFTIFASLGAVGGFFLLWNHNKKIGEIIVELYNLRPDHSQFFQSKYTNWLWENHPTHLGMSKATALLFLLICLAPIFNIALGCIFLIVDAILICRIVYLRTILKWPNLLEDIG